MVKNLFLFVSLLVFTCVVNSCGNCRWSRTYSGEDNCVEKLAGEEGFYNTGEGGVRRVINRLKRYKLVIHTEEGCFDCNDIDENRKEREVECPDFIPQSIQLSQLEKCSVGYYNKDIDGCDAPDSKLYFSTDNDYFKTAVVTGWPSTDILSDQPHPDWWVDFNSTSSDGKVSFYTWYDYYYYLGTSLRLAGFSWEEKLEDGSTVQKSIRVNADLY